MLPHGIRRTACALALAAPALAFAQAQGLRLERTLPGPPPADPAEVPIHVIADRMEGVASDELVASGDAELRKPTGWLKADTIRYFRATDEVEATGNVRLRVGGDYVTGPRLRMRVAEPQGIFEQASYELAPRARRSTDPRRSSQPVPIRGEAEALRLGPEDRYRLTDGSFTTCKPTETGWSISAEELDLDFGRSVGTARNLRLDFLGVKTPPIPYASFPLNDERKSGFLPPIFGIQGRVGPEILVPYYWNIAPNYDATITGRYMQKRGLQLIGEGRYLQPTFNGRVNLQYLPNDLELDTDRWYMSWQHTYINRTLGLSGAVNYNRVSDDNYFRDLSGRLALATQIYLPQDAFLTYGSSLAGASYSVTGRVSKFQTLQDPKNPIPIPYNRVPQILFSALKQNTLGGFDAGATAQFDQFEHPTLVTGSRTYVYPYLSYPLLTAGTFIVPKVGVNATYYSLDRVTPGLPTSPTRVLPIASVDAGAVFEREMQFGGREVIQTLEPRAYYLYVPYKDQRQLPVFDTSRADFNYAQIFSENAYLGWDRIMNANQVTLALTSRLIVPETGQEALRGVVGQIFYFQDQAVPLLGVAPQAASRSPYLLGLGGIVWPNVFAEAIGVFDPDSLRAQRLNAGIRYQPAINKVLNLGYRFTDAAITPPTGIRQVDVSGQWPIYGGVYAVARLNWDLNADKPVERLLGMEYNAGCWALRAVWQAFPNSAGQDTNVFFLQLELGGLASIGSNPFEILRRNIPGYTRFNQAPDPLRQQFDYFD
ncbi:MAG: LPS-assembly protein LptD [Burkholderiales bacterium]|nr:LPS-assembly protein LptD [Burkholderiales bacterium]